MLQVVKSTVATVAAWLLATAVLDLEQPFLAPWAALLTVHATVRTSVWRGGQTVAATFLGIIVSFLAVVALGGGVASLGAAVLVGLLLARLTAIRAEGVTVATTALFVLTSGTGEESVLLLHRFADTLLGVAVGVAVNLLVVPPLDDRLTERQLDQVDRRLGDLLRRIADDLSLPASDEHAQAWIAETRAIDADLDRGEELLRHSRESQRYNMRRRRSSSAGNLDRDESVMHRLEEGVAQARAIARTISDSVAEADEWDPRFREPWLALLREVGQRMADPYAGMADLLPRIDDLVRDLSHEDLPGLLWTVYGDLLVSLRTIVRIVDDVASVRAR
ncbi:FUSC family protein [Nocardioides sp. AX2bis]|uniref:FUSC family protein n=1 Tax=Nocardioides sp. AX2bis TaxID=2653157 RepID=UPI0022A79FB3|nr:FUSC family protein [Nocardioides sp. AX2bis]